MGRFVGPVLAFLGFDLLDVSDTRYVFRDLPADLLQVQFDVLGHTPCIADITAARQQNPSVRP
jgi:hypothetical protein